MSGKKLVEIQNLVKPTQTAQKKRTASQEKSVHK